MYPNLKLYLWQSRFRQNRLAKMLDMDEATLSRIVNGYREPSDELRRNIAEILNCDVHWLFEPADDMPHIPNPQTWNDDPRKTE